MHEVIEKELNALLERLSETDQKTRNAIVSLFDKLAIDAYGDGYSDGLVACAECPDDCDDE